MFCCFVDSVVLRVFFLGSSAERGVVGSLRLLVVVGVCVLGGAAGESGGMFGVGDVCWVGDVCCMCGVCGVVCESEYSMFRSKMAESRKVLQVSMSILGR